MSQQATLAKGFAAFAVLCAAAVWALGPVGTSAHSTKQATENTPALAQPQPSSPATVASVVKPSPQLAATSTMATPPVPATAVIAQTAIPLSTPSPAVSSLPVPTTSPTVSANARLVEADIAAQLRNKNIEFESKSDQLTPRGKEVIDSLLPVLSKVPQARFLIEGHTDSWGDKAYNQALSERRARAVKAYLTSKGLEAERFESKGIGDARPIADNASTAGSRKNRRIEFKAL